VCYDGDLPDADQQDSWALGFQPGFPCPIAKATNFSLRPLIPVILNRPINLHRQAPMTKQLKRGKGK